MAEEPEVRVGPAFAKRETKTYRVTLRVEQVIYADDEEDALGIFWDDLMRSQAEEENAVVEEM